VPGAGQRGTAQVPSISASGDQASTGNESLGYWTDCGDRVWTLFVKDDFGDLIRNFGDRADCCVSRDPVYE